MPYDFKRPRTGLAMTAIPLAIALAAPGAAFAQTPFTPALPAPTGPYAVGTDILHLVDASRPEPGARGRELMVQLWYPSRPSPRAARAPYLPDPALLDAMKADQYLNLAPDVLDTWRALRTHAEPGAPLAARPRRFPLLLFSPGFGMSRASYTAILEELASRGFVVAAVDHPGSGLAVFPGGRVVAFAPDPAGPNPEAAARRVEAMARDAEFVLGALLDPSRGRFAARLDPARVGIFGHSLGGAAALEACRAGGRFRACADLDGDPWGRVEAEGVGRPFLVLLNVPGPPVVIPAAMREQRDRQWADLVAKRATPAHVLEIAGTMHFTFGDAPFVAPGELLRKNGGVIRPERGLEVVTALLRAFFDRELGGRGDPLDRVARRYPEVTALR